MSISHLAHNFKRYPFIPIFGSFALGITIAYWLPGYHLVNLYIGLSSLLVRLVLSYVPTKKSPNYLLLSKCCTSLVTICAAGYYWLEQQNPLLEKQHIGHIVPTVQAYEGKVIADVTRRSKTWSTLLAVDRVQIADEWRKAQGKIKISGWGSSPNINYGHYLYIRGAPTPIPPPLNPYMTHARLFWQTQGVLHHHYLKKGSYKHLPKPHVPSLRSWLYSWRRKATQSLLHGIEDPDVASIIMAMLLGVRRELGDSIQNLYNQTGIMHILAISGLHVGLIYYLLLLLLYWLSFLFPFLKRYLQRIALSILGCYAIFTGWSPPVLRAWGMLLMWQLGKWLEKDVIPVNILAFVAFSLLLYNPYWLFNISFQLSFSAVATILLLYQPLIDQYQPQHPLPRYIWQGTLLSWTILLGTWPFSVYYFHGIALYSFVSNWLIIPLASLILVLSLSLIITSHYCIPVYQLSSQLLSWLFNIMHYSLGAIQSFPYAYIQHIFWPISTILLLYVGLIAIFKALISRERVYYYLALISLLGWGCKVGYDQYQVRHQPPTIIIYSVAPHTVIGFLEKGEATLLVEGNIERHDTYFLRAIAPSLAAQKIKHIGWYRWEDCLRTHKLAAREKKAIRYLNWHNQTIAWIVSTPPRPHDLPSLQAANIILIASQHVAWASQHPFYSDYSYIVAGEATNSQQSKRPQLHWLAYQGALTIHCQD